MPAVGTRKHEFGNVGHSVSLRGGLETNQPNSANYSEYYQDVIAARDGSIVNPCPFGCPDEELDEHGRCFHRIGVSPDGKVLEREKRDANGRVSMDIRRERVNGKLVPILERIDKRKHVLVRVTTSFLAYENRKCPDGWVPAGETDDADESAETEGGDDDGR